MTTAVTYVSGWLWSVCYTSGSWEGLIVTELLGAFSLQDLFTFINVLFPLFCSVRKAFLAITFL